jgi:hypothetical protein
METNNLPKLAELYEDNIEIAFKNDQFNLLMNQAPNPAWIKENKFAGNSKYIPIGIVETLLQKIFKNYRVEILREGVMFNAVYIAIRLHYINLITNEWTFHDGIGGVQLQTKQGTSPADLLNINNNAVMMALPMAKSYAIKDACEHIGKLFGRDLNRKDVLEFSTDKNISITQINDDKEKQRLINFISQSKNTVDLKNAIGNDILEKYDLLDLYTSKIEELSDGKN